MSPRPEHASVFPALAELITLRAAARTLELGARRLSLSAQAGGYRSVYRGRGLEFDEVRTYQPGDEVRAIDWRVTARRGRVHTRLYREERERPVLLLADLGPGMLFGSRRLKSAQVLHTGAILAWAAERAGDRVGAVVAAVAGAAVQPPQPRREAVLRLLRTLVELQPRRPGPLSPSLLDNALARLEHIAHPGSLLPVLSDFADLTEAGERALGRLCRHNDVVLIWIFDPLEAEPPPPGRYRLGLPGRLVELDSASAAANWRARFSDRQQRLQRLAHRLGSPLLVLSSAANPVQVLTRGLQRRGRAA
ncbi:MAG: DUF58 domain-containing protein [Pseudomonadota bacterium]